MSGTRPGNGRGEEPSGLGEIIRGVGHLLEMAERLSASGAPLRRHGEFNLGGKGGQAGEVGGLKGGYDLAIRLGRLAGGPSDGAVAPRSPAAARADRAGQRRPPAGGAGPLAQLPADAEVFVDVFEEAAATVISVEAPGLRPGSLEVAARGAELVLRGRGQGQAFSRAVHLGFVPRPESITVEYKSGLAVIAVPRPAEGADDQ